MGVYSVDGLRPKEIWGFIQGAWLPLTASDVAHAECDALEMAGCGYPVLVCDPMFNPNAAL